MRTYKSKFTRTYDLPTREEPLTITFTIHWSLENDGIGSYEYWGTKGYDHGFDYAVIDRVEFEDSSLSEAEKLILEDLINEDLSIDLKP